MKVKIYLTIEVDPDEYPVPADGNVSEEIAEGIEEYFYDVGGTTIKQFRSNK